MQKLIHILLILSFITVLIACPVPRTNSTAGSEGSSSQGADWLENTVWYFEETAQDRTQHFLIYLEKKNGHLTWVEPLINEAGGLKTVIAAAKINLHFRNGSSTEYQTCIFPKNNYLLSLGAGLRNDAGQFVTLYKAFFTTYEQGVLYVDSDGDDGNPNSWQGIEWGTLTKIPKPDLSLQKVDLSINSLKDTIWICDRGAQTLLERRYKALSFKEKDNSLVIYSTTHGTSTLEQALSNINYTAPKYKVKEFRSEKNYLVLDANDYDGKPINLYFPDSQYFGPSGMDRSYVFNSSIETWKKHQ